MNANDRKEANDLIGQMEQIQAKLQEMAETEREKFDNMSEGLQASERGQTIEQSADELENASNSAQETIDAINNAIGG